MTKFKIKETYLLMLIVVGLVSLGIYTTYAMFTASTTLNDVVGITTTLDVGKGLTEYQVVTVGSGETKLIELNIVNSYSSSIYYGAWYQIVQGNSSDIDIGLYTEKNSNPSSGSLATNGSINLLAGVTNNGTSSITVYIGAKGSLTNELNLGSNKTLLPSGFTEGYTVTLNLTNGVVNGSSIAIKNIKENENASFTITPNDGYRLNIDCQNCGGTLDKSTGVFTINNITENKECNVTISKKNMDNSGANDPEIVDGLIPVMYDGTKWVKADTTSSSSTYGWYDYNNKKWANAVLVTSTNRSTYLSSDPGTTITESDILAFYVWIPRYKYKVWNISKKQAKTESAYAYKANTEGIDIVFESGKESTGTISCTYNYNVDSANGGVDLSTTTAETCTGNNGDYYTHPAFTFGSDELRGFWISKYEISSSSPTTTDGGGNVTNLTVRSLPNVNSWRNNTVSNFSTVIQNMQTSNNIYGLSTSRTNTDSHMLTNYEWGAVAYLTNSKYGRCTDGSCTEVTINNCSSYITGIGANTVSASSSSTTCTTTVNKYDGTYGKLASTTGNITGVYDMSGGSDEYVMGNMSSVETGYTFYPSNSSFSSSWYTTDTAKYVTTYAYGTVDKNQKAYNRGRLGDATAEVVFSTTVGLVGWYSDYAYFPYSDNAWFERGGIGNSNGSTAGVFYFDHCRGNHYTYNSSRAALVSVSA